MRPANAAPGCAVTAAMALWTRDVVQPLAHAHFGQQVVELENLGSYNCRKIVGRQAQSAHSTANAIDLYAFVLADATRISQYYHWAGDNRRLHSPHKVRTRACARIS